MKNLQFNRSNPNLDISTQLPVQGLVYTYPRSQAYNSSASHLSYKNYHSSNGTTNTIDLEKSRRNSLLTSRITNTNFQSQREIYKNNFNSHQLEDSRKSNPLSLASTRCKLESSQISSALHYSESIRQTSSIQEKSYVLTEKSHIQQKFANYNFHPLPKQSIIPSISKEVKIQKIDSKLPVTQRNIEITHQKPQLISRHKSQQRRRSISVPKSNPLPKVETIMPKAIVDIKPKQDRMTLLKRAKDKIIKPLSFLPPALLLKSVTAHKVVKSDKQIPVIGAYFSNQKDKRFVLRQFSKMNKNKPISLKIIGVSSEKLIPTEVIKIPASQKEVQYDQQYQQDNASLIYSKRLHDHKPTKDSKSAKNINISIYKSPDVVIFAPQILPGQKLQKNHVKRIAVEGRPLTLQEYYQNQTDPILNEIQKVVQQQQLTPLEKYFALKKKLNLVHCSEANIKQNIQTESQVILCVVTDEQIEVNSQQMIEEMALQALYQEIILTQTQVINSETIFIQNRLTTQDQTQVQEYQLINYEEYVDSLSTDPVQSITSINYPAKFNEQQIIKSNPRKLFKQVQTTVENKILQNPQSQKYISKSLPNDIFEDLKLLKSKEGRTATNLVWYKLNQ